MTDLTAILSLIDAVLCCGLAAAVLRLRPLSWSQWSFIGGMLALGAESALNAMTIRAGSLAEIVHWQERRLLAASFVPGCWLIFSLCYSRGNYREFLHRWRATWISALVIPVAIALAFGNQAISGVVRVAAGSSWTLLMGWPGKALTLAGLLGAVLVLMNLERTFRASVGTMRWRIKYLMLGLAVLFGTRIYVTSQALLYSAIQLPLVTVSAAGAFVTCSLIALSLFRSRLSEVDIYPSHAVLRHSMTALLAGTYLLLVGLLAKAVAALGGSASLQIEALLVMIGLVGTTILVLSDRLRQKIRRFVSRHFRRPLYDYRKVWLTFTGRTTSLMDETDFCRAVAKLVAENFEVLSATVWLVDQDKDQLAFAASTALSESNASELANSLGNIHETIQAMRAHPHPVDIDLARETWVENLKQCNPEYFHKGGGRVCVPLVSGGEVIGLITLGDRVSGASFSMEDLDLLKCIGDQVAASLRNIKLSQRLVQAKEMEAFQTMSAFFVHDLKNTASTLSLMLQNMSRHFQDPAFQEDAVRGLSKSVSHLNGLINELTLLRQGLELKSQDSDLNQVVMAVLAGLDGTADSPFVKNLSPLPRIPLDPAQMQKVVTNLVINAKEAATPRGEIRVETARRNGWVVLSVADNGCGMTPEFIRRSLFRPFQSTKKKGLGIGMFHSKMIVDAHRGRIEVESETGKGTTFRVWLPVPNSNP
jgi:putative PEP-CTERM system histidine kinase